MKFSSSALPGFLLLSFISAANDLHFPAILPGTQSAYKKSVKDIVNTYRAVRPGEDNNPARRS